jgi:hypothetical protein
MDIAKKFLDISKITKPKKIIIPYSAIKINANSEIFNVRTRNQVELQLNLLVFSDLSPLKL